MSIRFDGPGAAPKQRMIVLPPYFRKATLMAWLGLFRAAVAGWVADRAPSMGAAMAYYMVFSLAPMLILVIAIAGLAFGQAAAQGAIVAQLGDLMGVEGAAALQAMIMSAGHKRAGIIATLVGTGTLLVASTAVFVELQAALNVIWKVQRRPRKALIAAAREQLVSLSLILALGFLLLVSLVLSAALTAFGDYLQGIFPGLPLLLRILHVALSFGVMTILFGMIFKILPDAAGCLAGRVDRRDDDGGALQPGQVSDRPLYRQQQRRLDLWRRRRIGHHPAVDLLLGADTPLRRGVHQGVRRSSPCAAFIIGPWPRNVV